MIHRGSLRIEDPLEGGSQGHSLETVSLKPLGSVSSNCRVFHGVSNGSTSSAKPAALTRAAIASCAVSILSRVPIPFVRSHPFFQSS
jgi:hypothetical protein